MKVWYKRGILYPVAAEQDEAETLSVYKGKNSKYSEDLFPLGLIFFPPRCVLLFHFALASILKCLLRATDRLIFSNRCQNSGCTTSFLRLC